MLNCVSFYGFVLRYNLIARTDPFAVSVPIPSKQTRFADFAEQISDIIQV